MNQGEYYTMQLLEDIIRAGRVVVCDNWFTSLSLAKNLRSHNMHLVGTIRCNKPYLPSKVFIKELKLPKDDTVALYNHEDRMSLVLKKVKSSKFVGILSTIHNKLTVVEGSKTEAHMFYNAAKGGTDAFDQRCAITSCSRRTSRWPMAVFFQMVNIAMNNAFILYSERPVEQNKIYKHKADYLHKVAYRMCRPWAIFKYQHTDPRHKLNKEMIDQVFNLTPAEKVIAPQPAPRDAPQPAPRDAPQPAPRGAPQPAHLPWLPHNVPPNVAGATRLEQPRQDPGDHPYLGGRWIRNSKTRCSFCPQESTWRGKYKCELPQCGHKDVCPSHSVILCQKCFYNNL